MTNKNRKRRDGYREPSKERRPEAAAPAPRPGLMNSLFSARLAGASNMPRVRMSFARGFVLVISTPVMLVGTVVLVFLVWIAALVAGLQGPAAMMASALAVPPIGVIFDLQLTSRISIGAGAASTLIGAIPFVIAQAIALGLLLGIAVETLEGGRPSMSGVRRGLLAAPMVLIVSVIQMGFLLVATTLGGFFGQGIGLLVFVAAIAGSLYLLGYAPTAQLREGRGVLESLSRSTSAARIPGTSALAMALIYAIPAAFLLQLIPQSYDVNPSAGTWVFVLLVNVFHVSALVTYAYRWMCIEDEVPETPVPRARTRRR